MSDLKHETVEIIIYILALIILGIWLKDLFAVSWQFRLFYLPFNVISDIIAMGAGIYFGILVATILKDAFKRIQAVLLCMVSIYVATYYIHHIYNNILLFIVFFGGALYYADKQEVPSCRYNIRRKSIKDRPLAIVTFLASFFLLISLLNYLIGYYYNFHTFPNSTMNYVLFAGVFIAIFLKFMNYEFNQIQIFIVGPPHIGKTVFMVALCNTANGDPNIALRNVRNSMTKEWPERTREAYDLEFNFRRGRLFTKCIKISTYDYPGAYLFEDIKDSFKWLDEKKKELNPYDFHDLISKINLSKELPTKISRIDDTIKIIRTIAESKKLIFLISATSILRQDMQMVEGGYPSGEFKNYINIYEIIASVTDKPVMIVVTKVDREYAYELNSLSYIDDVAKWILADIKESENIFFLKNTRLVRRDKSFTKDESSLIFPCWVEGDEIKPKLNEKGEFVMIGYDEFLKRL
ncbi:Uncharacterised protein [uncultured archaeon]|nr:Uncharacterised protein [uncultured archaeon]